MPDDGGGELVSLYVYDLSGGLARQLSPMLLGKQLDGIWHSSIVVGGSEYYFGFGINQSRPGESPFGRPAHVYNLGTTHIPREIRNEFLADLGERYTPASYSLLYNNCNNFSNELAQLLVGQSIPDHITGLPQEVISTPFGQMLLPMLQGLERQLGSVRQQAAFDPGADPGLYEDDFYDAKPISQTQAAQQAQQGVEFRPESSAAAAARASKPASAGHDAAAAASADAGSSQGAKAVVQQQQQPQLQENGTEQPHTAGSDSTAAASAERAGSAMDAAAQQIAAATGLAMVEEAEERLAATTGAANRNTPEANRVGMSPACAAAATAGAAENGNPAANSAGKPLAGQQVANGCDLPALPPAAPASRQLQPPARSAAAAAAAAAAERRARALAGSDAQASSCEQASTNGLGADPGSASAKDGAATPVKTAAVAAAVAPAEAELALAATAATPSNAAAALGAVTAPANAASVLERSRRAAVEEAVREEFVHLVGQGGMTAEEAAATAARDAAQAQGE